MQTDTTTKQKKLYPHQQKFVNENPDKALLVWEMQTGKTLAACEWIKKRPTKKILVACPKSIIGKWKRELKEAGAIADVCSRDDVKKIDLNKYDGICLDEAQDFMSPAFTKQRSQRTTVLYNYVKTHPDAPVLLLSATPIRSTAWNCHTAACYLGTLWPIKEFRDKFFFFTDRYGVMHWEPKKTWRIDIRPYLESIANIVLAKDVVDRPKANHEIINIPWTKEQESILGQQYLEPAAEFSARRRAEQSDEKWKKIKEVMDGYRKVILVVYYRDQIEDYIKRIGNDREVFVLHGGIKDQDSVIEAAKKADDGIFILQASMGAGFSAAEFSVMIFASMSFKYVDYMQATGRMDSLDNLHVNNYVYMIGGRTDKSVYDTILSGNDFNPHKYMLNYTDEQRTSITPQSIEQTGGQSNSDSREVDEQELPF